MVPLVVPLLLHSCLALHISVPPRPSAAGCRDAVPGEWCHTALAWAKEKGATEHRDWFPGDVSQYTAWDFQSLLHQLGVAQCTLPCAPEHADVERQQYALGLLQMGEAQARGFGAAELEELLASTGAPDGPATAASTLDCEDAAEGSLCHHSVTWLLESGFAKHPEWYPGLSSDTPFQDVQMMLHSLGKGGCKRPCQKALLVPDGQYTGRGAAVQPPHHVCGDAAPGGWCSNSMKWLRNFGFDQHPDWYPSLGPGSTDREVQAVLHQQGKAQCPKPCSERDAVDALEEPAAAVEPTTEPEPQRAAKLACSNAEEGSACFDKVVAQMAGVRDHPERYPGITSTSSFEEVQETLFDRMLAGCTRPCPAVHPARVLADGGSRVKKPYGDMTMGELKAYMDGEWDGMVDAATSTTAAVHPAEAAAEALAAHAPEPAPRAPEAPSAARGARGAAAGPSPARAPSAPAEALPVVGGPEARGEPSEEASAGARAAAATAAEGAAPPEVDPEPPVSDSAAEPVDVELEGPQQGQSSASRAAEGNASEPAGELSAAGEPAEERGGAAGQLARPAGEESSATQPAQGQSNAGQLAEARSSAAMSGSEHGDAGEPLEEEGGAAHAADEHEPIEGGSGATHAADAEMVSPEPLPLVASDEVVRSAVEERLFEEPKNSSWQELLKDIVLIVDKHADDPVEVANETSEALEGMSVITTPAEVAGEIREDLSKDVSASTTRAGMEISIQAEVLTGMTSSTTPAEISAEIANESQEDRPKAVSVSTAPSEPPASMFRRIREKVRNWITASTTTAEPPSDKAPQIGEDELLKEINASTPVETLAGNESSAGEELRREPAAETTVPQAMQVDWSGNEERRE